MTKHSRDYELAETERRLERGQIITFLIGLAIGLIIGISGTIFTLS